MGRIKQLCGFGCCWLSLSAFAPQARLPYDLSAISDEAPVAAQAGPGAQPARLGYEVNDLLDAGTELAAPRAPPPVPPPGRGARPRSVAALTIDVGAIADSNINNATNLPFVVMNTENGPVPVPLPAESRRRSGVGLSASSAAMLDLSLSEGLALAGDAEIFVVDQRGGANDDVSLLVAIGPEMSWAGRTLASVQLLAFQRWYGGITLTAGGGVRGVLQVPAGKDGMFRLLAEGRWFGSGYGPDLEGSMGTASLSFEALLGPTTSASAALFVRHQSLGSRAYSSTELGLHTGLSRYLGPHLTASLSLGVSRAVFDAAQAWLSQEPRRDWRVYGTLSGRTRRPLLWRLHPNVSYTFGRTESSVPFFDADRHALRLGMDAAF